MTATQQTQVTQEQKPNDKETNFRLQEKALQEKYERQLAQERQARLELEKKLQEQQSRAKDDDDDDSEPYVDHKKLNKTLSKFEQNTMQKTQTEIQKAVQQAKEEARKEAWLEQNPDFFDVLQNAERFAQKAPNLAKTILNMPEGFERQKLVYENIKTLGLDQAEKAPPSIQETIDKNKKSYFYQPSQNGTPPYNGNTYDCSPQNQKAQYEKMMELKKRLRLS